MNLSHRIQAKTDNGDTVIDFLIEVMQSLPRTRYGDERDGFKICHRLDAARLLTKYGCACKSDVAERDEAIDFILENPPEPSRTRAGSRSSDESMFDTALARVIQKSTDDGASVCRFLVNVMEGDLTTFKPHHRIAAARELLDRGFGRSARAEAAAATSNHPSVPVPTASAPVRQSGNGESHPVSPVSSEAAATAIATADADPRDQQQTEDDDEGWAAFWEEMAPILEEEERRKTEQPDPEADPDNLPYIPDYSAFNEAWENSEIRFEEWKNSLDPSEYEAIIADEAAKFCAMVDRKVERRAEIAEERERREKEAAEREAQQPDPEPEEESEPGPPTRSQHKRKLGFVLGNSMYVECGHPECKVCVSPRYYPEDDRSSPHYFDGRAPPMYGNYGL